jgi:hypothetical protein
VSGCVLRRDSARHDLLRKGVQVLEAAGILAAPRQRPGNEARQTASNEECAADEGHDE